MKRKTKLLVAALAAITMLTACGSFTCDLCGEKKSGKCYTNTVLGKQVTLCSDCHDMASDVADTLSNLF